MGQAWGITCAALVLAVAAIGTAGSARTAKPPEVAPAVATGDAFPHHARFPNGVSGLADIVYETRPGFRPLTLDLYSRRNGKARPSPLVVYVHGGAWRAGHSRAAGALSDFPAVLASLASRGFVVASVDYRLSGEAPFPAAVDDLQSALRFLTANAGRFGIDPDRTILWGSSAGSQIAGLVATRPSGKAGADALPHIRGVVSWYGIFDLVGLESPSASAGSPTAAYLGCDPRACEQVAADASPMSHVDGSAPPFLLLHGLDDHIVPAGQSRAMESRLRAAGAVVETVYYRGADHSWIGASPDSTRDVTLDALQRTFGFIEARTIPGDRAGRPKK